MIRMKTIVITLMLLISNAVLAQYNYTDIGDTRLIDSFHVLVIRAKPGKDMGTQRILKPTTYDKKVTVNDTIVSSVFSGNGSLITGIPQSAITNLSTDLSGKVSTSNTVNGYALSSNPTLTKADLHIDTTNYALSSRTVNGHALTSNVTVTKADIGSDTTNYTKGQISVYCAAMSPADNTNYYFGAYSNLPPLSNELQVKYYFNLNCTITKISIQTIPTTTGSNENVVYKLKRYGSTASDTASYTITTAGQLNSNSSSLYYSSNVSITITAGDAINIKIETPNFATNPLTVYFRGDILYQ